MARNMVLTYLYFRILKISHWSYYICYSVIPNEITFFFYIFSPYKKAWKHWENMHWNHHIYIYHHIWWCFTIDDDIWCKAKIIYWHMVHLLIGNLPSWPITSSIYPGLIHHISMLSLPILNHLASLWLHLWRFKMGYISQSPILTLQMMTDQWIVGACGLLVPSPKKSCTKPI